MLTDLIYRNTTPGGYIELSDCVFPIRCDDNSMSPDSAISKWSELSLSGTVKIGRPLDSEKYYKDELNMYKWPMNRWPEDPKFKELGMFWRVWVSSNWRLQECRLART
jgi:hypothetical protein